MTPELTSTGFLFSYLVRTLIRRDNEKLHEVCVPDLEDLRGLVLHVEGTGHELPLFQLCLLAAATDPRLIAVVDEAMTADPASRNCDEILYEVEEKATRLLRLAKRAKKETTSSTSPQPIEKEPKQG